VKLTRKSTGRSDGLYCLQKTNTHRPTPELSFTPSFTTQKSGFCHAILLCRAKRPTSNESNYQQEMTRIQAALKNNGYPLDHKIRPTPRK